MVAGMVAVSVYRRPALRLVPASALPCRRRLIQRCGSRSLAFWAAQRAGDAPNQASKQALYRAAMQAGLARQGLLGEALGGHRAGWPPGRLHLRLLMPSTAPSQMAQRAQNALLEAAGAHTGVDTDSLKRLFEEVIGWGGRGEEGRGGEGPPRMGPPCT